METGEKLKSDKMSQTAQQCLNQSSPPEIKPPLVKIPVTPEVKTERVTETERSLDRPVKKEPEEQDKGVKDDGSLGIKIVECWSLQKVKEEPVDVPLANQPPPYAGVRCKSEGGATAMPRIKQEVNAEECHGGGGAVECRKRPATPTKQLGAETEMVLKKFRPLHQPQQTSTCEGLLNASHGQGAWPVKVEKDPMSRDFIGEGGGTAKTVA